MTSDRGPLRYGASVSVTGPRYPGDRSGPDGNVGQPERSVGRLVRDWRHRRGQSQLQLAHDAGVSPRHLSFVENGRSRPSPELILTLAERLDIPLRDRNVLLLAAGYAPRYPRTSLSDPSMQGVRTALRHIISNHDPFPGTVIDRLWNAVMPNEAATRLIEHLPPELVGPPTNIFRICLHPDGLAKQTINFPEWARHLLHHLRHLVAVTADPQAQRLADEVLSYPTVAMIDRCHPTMPTEEPDPFVPWRLEVAGVQLSFFTTLTVFGTPQNVTLAELAIELFYPADEATAVALRTRR